MHAWFNFDSNWDFLRCCLALLCKLYEVWIGRLIAQRCRKVNIGLRHEHQLFGLTMALLRLYFHVFNVNHFDLGHHIVLDEAIRVVFLYSHNLRLKSMLGDYYFEIELKFTFLNDIVWERVHNLLLLEELRPIGVLFVIFLAIITFIVEVMRDLSADQTSDKRVGSKLPFGVFDSDLSYNGLPSLVDTYIIN